MITDNQAKEAIKTIAEYCSQFPYDPCCEGCTLQSLCRDLQEHPIPEFWPEYLGKNHEEGA